MSSKGQGMGIAILWSFQSISIIIKLWTRFPEYLICQELVEKWIKIKSDTALQLKAEVWLQELKAIQKLLRLKADFWRFGLNKQHLYLHLRIRKHPMIWQKKYPKKKKLPTSKQTIVKRIRAQNDCHANNIDRLFSTATMHHLWNSVVNKTSINIAKI